MGRRWRRAVDAQRRGQTLDEDFKARWMLGVDVQVARRRTVVSPRGI